MSSPQSGRRARPSPESTRTPKVPAARLETIDDVVADALAKQSRFSELLAQIDDEEGPLSGDLEGLGRLFALHGQNASRLGRLLRDQRALSGQAADGLLEAIGKALDEISTELGVTL